jgi:hypothetical protein
VLAAHGAPLTKTLDKEGALGAQQQWSHHVPANSFLIDVVAGHPDDVVDSDNNSLLHAVGDHLKQGKYKEHIHGIMIISAAKCKNPTRLRRQA